MDGLSAAASGMAVVSLAIQLVGSVRKIRCFLHSVSEAPEELRRLLDLLEQLELILEQVETLVEGQQRNTLFPETGAPTCVLRAIKTCEGKVALIESLVEVSKQASATSNRAARAIGSFKLACKKKDIQGLENQLHDAISLLSLTMMANLTLVHSQSMGQLLNLALATNQSVNAFGHEANLTYGDLSNNPGISYNDAYAIVGGGRIDRAKSTKSRLLRKQSTMFRSYTSLFGTLLIRRASRSTSFTDNKLQSASKTYSSSVSSWFFRPSFLSRCFEYQSLNTYGSIQRAIRIYPLIQDDHPIWTMCAHGDLVGIQALLSTRRVSPFSVDTKGMTLLHRASQASKIELCEFLFDLGLNGQEVTARGLLPYVSPPKSLDDISELRRIYALFKSRCEYFDAAIFRFLFVDPKLAITLKAFNGIIDEILSQITIDAFDISPISTAIRMLRKSEPELRDGWMELIHRLLALGPDLYACPTVEDGTMIDEIMNIAQCPFESYEVGNVWLAILERFGVDIDDYLRTERTLQVHFDDSGSLPMLSPYFRVGALNSIRHRYLIFSENIPRISWDWYIDPKGPAFEVLYEFRHTGPSCHVFEQDYNYPEELSNWPYFYPRWDSCRSASSSRWITKEMRNSIINLFERRFERRWLNKLKKIERAQGSWKGPKLPGAWID